MNAARSHKLVFSAVGVGISGCRAYKIIFRKFCLHKHAESQGGSGEAHRVGAVFADVMEIHNRRRKSANAANAAGSVAIKYVDYLISGHAFRYRVNLCRETLFNPICDGLVKLIKLFAANYANLSA